MADSENKGGGAADIISSVLNAGAVIFSSVNASKQARNSRLPDWLSPRDFKRKDYTLEIIIGGMVLVILIVLGILSFKAK